jgi:hypothetical protein
VAMQDDSTLVVAMQNALTLDVNIP